MKLCINKEANLVEKTDINKVMSDAEKGIFHWDYYDKWQEFKKALPYEDRMKWDEIKDRMHKNENGQRFLEPPLTDEEKAWAMDIMRRAMDWGIS